MRTLRRTVFILSKPVRLLTYDLRKTVEEGVIPTCDVVMSQVTLFFYVVTYIL